MLQVVLKNVYYGLLLSGFTILLIRRRKLGSIFPIFGALYFFNLVTQITFDIVSPMKINGVPLFHINQFIGSLLLHSYYYITLRNTLNKQIVIAGFAFFTVYFGYHFVFHIENIFTVDFSDFVVEGIFLCVYAVLHLLETYRSNTIISPARNLHFWLSTGNLIFFSGCTFVMGFLNYLKQNNLELYSKVAYINYFLNLLLYSLYIKAFLCDLEPKK
jgi:hypothetical protein